MSVSIDAICLTLNPSCADKATPLTDYEKHRVQTVQGNNQVLKSLGLSTLNLSVDDIETSMGAFTRGNGPEYTDPICSLREKENTQHNKVNEVHLLSRMLSFL